jgi:hypothetical protein
MSHNFRCDNPEEHGCVIPQIPVGELSEVMSALNREIAEKVSLWSVVPFNC